MSTVRDRFWIWGHVAGSHDEHWNLPAPSRITPVEAAHYLGVPNLLMVNYGGKPEPPFDQEAVAQQSLKQVVWSIIGDSSSNIITPLMPYFPLVVVFCQRYVKKTGIGTLVSLMLPYAIVFITLWTAFLIVYWICGYSLGLQASYVYP